MTSHQYQHQFASKLVRIHVGGAIRSFRRNRDLIALDRAAWAAHDMVTIASCYGCAPATIDSMRARIDRVRNICHAMGGK
jgi:hypothetical protein